MDRKPKPGAQGNRAARTAQARYAQRCAGSIRFEESSRQSPGSSQGGSGRTAQHPNQWPMANMLHLGW